VQSQVRFNRVPEKVPEKVPGGFGAKPSQVQQCSEEGPGEALVQRQVRFSRVPEKVEPGRVPQGSGEGSGEGSGKVWEAWVESQVRFNRFCGHFTHGNPAEVFSALGFAACFRKICKCKMLRLLGIPPKPFLYQGEKKIL